MWGRSEEEARSRAASRYGVKPEDVILTQGNLMLLLLQLPPVQSSVEVSGVDDLQILFLIISYDNFSGEK